MEFPHQGNRAIRDSTMRSDLCSLLFCCTSLKTASRAYSIFLQLGKWSCFTWSSRHLVFHMHTPSSLEAISDFVFRWHAAFSLFSPWNPMFSMFLYFAICPRGCLFGWHHQFPRPLAFCCVLSVRSPGKRDTCPLGFLPESTLLFDRSLLLSRWQTLLGSLFFYIADCFTSFHWSKECGSLCVYSYPLWLPKSPGCLFIIRLFVNPST